MKKLEYNNEWLKSILSNVHTIAVVGASAKADRPSNHVMAYLQDKGYRVIPINPGLAGQKILGELVYASLTDVAESYQMVDIFRNSDAAGAICDEAIDLKDCKNISVIWMQQGVRNDEAAHRAERAGLKVVMDRCPKIEHKRLIEKDV
jgi:predicted CoA-binding protein